MFTEFNNQICNSCIDSCHVSHYSDKTLLQKVTVPYKGFRCSCAEANHVIHSKVISDEFEREKDKEETYPCFIGDLLKFTNVKKYYKENASGTVLCSHCREYCIIGPHLEKFREERGDDVPTEEQLKEEGDNFAQGELTEYEINEYTPHEKCQCVNHDLNTGHIKEKNKLYSNCQNYFNLPEDSILGKKAGRSDFDVTQVLGILLSDEKLFKIFFEQFSKGMNDFNLALQEVPFNQTKALKLKTMNMERCLIFFNCFITYIYRRNCFFYDIPKFQNTFNIKLLTNVFNPELKFWDKMLYEKIFLLRCFRKFYICPKVNIPYLKPLLSGYLNISPVHRALFREEFNELFASINIPRVEYYELLDRIYYNLKHLVYSKPSLLPVVKGMQVMFQEYIKLVQFLFYYSFELKSDDFKAIEKYILSN